MQHQVHARTDVGRVRERNEDSHRLHRREDGVHLLIVCDGMGGHSGGDVASRIAAETIEERLKIADRGAPAAAIREALTEANVRVNAATTPDKGLDMGTTAVVAWVDGSKLWYGWVGDSRLYHFRGPARMRMTADHTRVQLLMELGLLTENEARRHPESHMLMQAIGGGPSAQQGFAPSVTDSPAPMAEGDVLLLSTDGLHDLVEEPAMLLAIDGKRPEEATHELIYAALQAGGHDNVTVALLVAGRGQVPELAPDQRAWLASRIQRRKPRGPGRLRIGIALLVGAAVGTVIGVGLSNALRGWFWP